MKLDWLCAEKATAVSLGCAGLMLADGGLIAGGTIAGAGLLGLWNKARRADGVNSEKLLADARAALLADYANWAEGRDLAEADLIAADKAMERHLFDCVPQVADLARTTFHNEEFPAHAALLVVDRLADKNPIFSDTHSSRSPVARELALLVMQSALTKAKEQPAFLQRLEGEVVLLLPKYLVAIKDAVTAADEGSQQRDAAMEAMLQQIIANQQQSAAAQGVSADKLRMLALRIVAKVEDEGEAERALSAAIDELLKLRAEAERGTNFGDEVDEAIRRIFAKVEANDLDGAGRQGAEEYSRLAEMMQGLQAAQASLAETNLSVARMAFDAEAMAHWAVERRRLAAGVAVLSVDQLRSEQDEWYETALRRGQRLEMDVAIHLARHSIAAATTPSDRAMCENDLGIALQVQGERSGGAAGIALLGEAVAAYRAALEVRTRAALPADWAATQNNLGVALQVQGERSGGAAGIALLADAVAAYRAALEVRTRAALPAEWALTQNNLGAALRVQGTRSGGAAGLALLGEAVAAYRSALEVRTRDALPADWAMTQNNLGNALSAQGERNGGDAGIALLVEAVAAYRAALEVYARDAFPAQWATTQQNIALAEEARGDLSAGGEQRAYWRSAEAAVSLALEVYDPVNMPYDHEKATTLLARIKGKIATAA
jgi:tetratricopeptide (TPR) repeat protein